MRFSGRCLLALGLLAGSQAMASNPGKVCFVPEQQCVGVTVQGGTAIGQGPNPYNSLWLTQVFNDQSTLARKVKTFGEIQVLSPDFVAVRDQGKKVFSIENRHQPKRKAGTDFSHVVVRQQRINWTDWRSHSKASFGSQQAVEQSHDLVRPAVGQSAMNLTGIGRDGQLSAPFTDLAGALFYGDFVLLFPKQGEVTLHDDNFRKLQVLEHPVLFVPSTLLNDVAHNHPDNRRVGLVNDWGRDVMAAVEVPGETTETGFPLFRLLPRKAAAAFDPGFVGLEPIRDGGNVTDRGTCETGYAREIGSIARRSANSSGCYQDIYGWIGHWKTDQGRRYAIMDMRGERLVPGQFRSVRVAGNGGDWALLVQQENGNYQLMRVLITRLGTAAFFRVDGEYPDAASAWSARHQVFNKDLERLWEQQEAGSTRENPDNPLDW